MIGSFIRITQKCDYCSKERYWTSQPFVNDTPLGNLLISAAILYTGSLPAKTLQFFKALKCATITPKTYFRHQKRFLHPAVNSVYTRHQNELIEGCRNRELILAGDGRADSPGHSAIFGSYTVLDLDTNKVLDFQLVQVLWYT